MISVFELFSIGVGPSSSHTVGPMRAAKQFMAYCHANNLLDSLHSVCIDLYGSLALTGKGHGTDIAVLMGLEGYAPESVDPHFIKTRVQQIRTEGVLRLLNQKETSFQESEQLRYLVTETLPYHTNAVRFTAFDKDKNSLATELYYSVGGGFIVNDRDIHAEVVLETKKSVPYPFTTAKELLFFCDRDGKSISDIVLDNERVWRDDETIHELLGKIWSVMQGCIEAGCQHEGLLPGGLDVRRRAPAIFQQLHAKSQLPLESDMMAWLNCYAMAVNEENAAGGRVVTAPTNGAAGIIPSVLNYYMVFNPHANARQMSRFLLTAAGIGILYKEKASISGAEVGCQGEVGVACSMAAGALAEVLGGTVMQVENAAEIGMEHHLGLTCDPIGGLVQIPCIERNAMAAVRAVNAAQLALMENGEHKVSLDKVILTMAQTGKDMMTIYKETSKGGLAVNHPEC